MHETALKIPALIWLNLCSIICNSGPYTSKRRSKKQNRKENIWTPAITKMCIMPESNWDTEIDFALELGKRFLAVVMHGLLML